MPISDQLRDAIQQTDLSLHQIARATGVSQPILSRFMSGDPDKNDIRLQRTADKLAEYFGLELVPKKGAAKSTASGKPSTTSPSPSRPRRGRGRRTAQKLTPKQMAEEIERVQAKNENKRRRGLKVVRAEE